MKFFFYHLGFIVLVFGWSHLASAEEVVEGMVRLYGSALQAETLIGLSQGPEATKLCGSEIEQKVRHLTDLVISVSGDWHLNKGGDKDCFTVRSFRVLRASSGRNALSGRLLRAPGGFIIQSDDGHQTLLAEIPDGVKKLLGQKVIMDVKALASPVATDATKVVVSYRPWP